jgi:hypothetical protein
MSISGLHVSPPGFIGRAGRAGDRFGFPLPVGIALAAAAASFAWNLADYLSFVLFHARKADFYLYYVAAKVGLTHGWQQIYNPAVFIPAVTAAGGTEIPYLNPPPMAWVALPFSLLPYPLALAIWLVITTAAFLLIWHLATAGSRRLQRYGLLLLALALYAVTCGLRLGQVTFVVMAGVTLCWWLLKRDRPFLAGMALSVMALKPQTALLIPVCLLLAGYWRVVAGWALVVVPLVALSLLALGVEGIQNWRAGMAYVYQLPGLTLASVSALTGPGLAPLALVISVGAGLTALFVAWRVGGRRVELVIAAGLAGSAMVSPYLNLYDLAMALLLGVWLVLRLNPPAWVKWIMVAGFLPLELVNAPYAHPPLLLVECAWMVALAAMAVRRPEPAIPAATIRPTGNRGRRIVAPS